MTTEKIFYQNQYTRSFTARVLSCMEGRGGWEVILDRTAFYPEGGGQPGDTGALGGSAVLDTHEWEGRIIHCCAAPLEPGTAVEGEIDWPRRFDFMQQHSGEHIVSGLIHQHFGCNNVGFHMGAAATAIDFDAVLTAEDMGEIERLANEKVWENVPIEASLPTPGELEKIPYRSKKELSGQVRIVTVPGADVCACCGTHVSRTGEIGLIKLISCQKLRQGVRMELLCGRRAYEYVNRVLEQNHRTSVLLSAKPLETAAAVERLHGELESVRYRMVGYEDRLFAAKARELAGRGDVLLFEEGLSPDSLRRLSAAVMEACSGRCAAFSGSDNEGYKYAVGQAGGDLRTLINDMNAALNGRGGGKPFFAQGSVNCTRAEIESFFAERK